MKFILPFLTLAAAAASSNGSIVDHEQYAKMAYLKARHFNTKREMAAKQKRLQPANALRYSPAFPSPDGSECDWANEETCYDDNGNVSGCEPYATGGCPCPAGQEKCDPYNHIGWCTEPELCCAAYEEACYDENWTQTGCAKIEDGGCPCPEGQTKCGADSQYNMPGWCTEICCADDEETCYDENWSATGCSALSDGGCPCPAGEERCGGTDYWPGYCTPLCCADGEEVCYDDSSNPTECKAIADGGCPCSGDQVKCHALPEWDSPGWCVDECCTDEQEECYDYETGTQTCADIAAGGCPCLEGEEKCGANLNWGYAGYCTEPEFCCADNEELCYSDDFYPQPEECKSIADGGCPCPEGEEKCGAVPEENISGYCSTLCCEEQTCYDMTTYTPTSCATWDEICPTGITFDQLKKKTTAEMDHNELKKESYKLHKIKALKTKMMAGEYADHKGIEKMIQAEELAILRKVKKGIDKKSFVQEVPAFMKVY